MIQSWKYQKDRMLLFLLVFNLIEIHAVGVNTECKRYYERPENSFWSSSYTFVPFAPDLSQTKVQRDHIDEFTCGEYCVNITKGDICECGGETIDHKHSLRSHEKYCCNTGSCSIFGSRLNQSTIVTCPNATLIPLSEKCQDDCPALTQGFSNFSLSTKCDTNDTCLKDFDANQRHAKVCHHQNQNLTNFFQTFCPSDVGQACDPAFQSKIAYKQCFNDIHPERQTIKCWSRTDQKDHLFNRTLTNQGVRLRVNLNNILPRNETHFNCTNQSFRWDNACKESESFCDLPIGRRLAMKSEAMTPTICGDHSFWKLKCINATNRGDCTINPDFGKRGEEKDFCDQPDDFYCPKSSTCTKKSLTCNGLVDCFHGEDEAFELCHKESFVEAATIKCIESNRNGDKIEILAVPCNGIRECQDGSDEDNCATMLHFTIVTMMTCCTTAVASWWYVFFLIKLKDKKRRIKMTLPPNRKQLVKKRLTGNRLASLKNTTDYVTCANVMEVCNKDDNPSFFKKSLNKIKDYVERPKVYFILGPFHLIGANMDFIKDCILLYIIAKALGGPSTIFANYTIFSSVVWIMMLIIVVFPTVLAGARLAATPDLIFGSYAVKSTKHRIGFAILLLMLSPFLSLIIRLKKAYLDMLSRIEPENQAIIKERDEMMTSLSHHVKLELGLETVFQLFGSLLLLFNAISSTRTTDALNQIFNDINDNNKTISTFILVASACWSFKSCLKAHLYGLGYCREVFPIQSKIIAGLFAFFAGTKRILTLILFFAPPLGLFNLLKHLQAEQIPFDKGLGGFLDNDGTLQLGNSEPFKWTEPFKTGERPILDRWNGSTNLAPEYILYSTCKLQHYFFAFLALLLVHFVVICIVKLCLSQGYKQLNGLEKVIHVMECSHIASTSQEWDACQGDAQEHIKWMKRNQKEGFALIAVNFVFGLLFLLPFALFTYKIVERHGFLLNSIGVLEQEVQAYKDVQIWMGSSTLYLVFATIMEIVLFWLYNQKYHPFADILDVKEDEQEMKELRGEVEVGQSVFYENKS